MAVTIKDVAALAGVSSSTVSRTCKNNPSISEETKEKVRRAMAQLGYEPTSRPAIWLPRIPVPSGSFCLFPPERHTKIPFIWKPSAGSASCATSGSISTP